MGIIYDVITDTKLYPYNLEKRRRKNMKENKNRDLAERILEEIGGEKIYPIRLTVLLA